MLRYLYSRGIWGVFFILFPFLSLWSQVTLQGRVLDHSKEPLPLVSVVLKDTLGKMQAGQATNLQGDFFLKGLIEGNYTLELSYVGYKTYKKGLRLKKGALNIGNIILEEAGELGEVRVVAKATEVVVKGDTIEYNASSYKTEEGVALVDLIKKLPGAELDDNGNIKVHGKNISKIMVDGKRFFDSDPKVALKKLPVDLIDKIQVHSRETDQARMSGFSDGEDQTVINLSIKPGRKKGLFGTALAGVGSRERYEMNTIFNRFQDASQWTILGGLNNTNNTGFSEISSDVQGTQNQRGRRRGQGNAPNNKGVTVSRMFAGNLSVRFSTETEFGANANLGNSDKLLETQAETVHIQTTGNTLEKSQERERNKRWDASSNLRLDWKPRPDTELILTPHLSYGTSQGVSNTTNSMEYEATGQSLSRGLLSELNDSKTLNAGANLDFSRRFGTCGRTFSLGAEFSLGYSDLASEYHNEVYFEETSKTKETKQLKKNEDFKQRYAIRLSYVEPLSKTLMFNLNYRLRGDWTNSSRDVYEFEPQTASFQSLNSELTHEINTRFLTHRLGVALKHKTSVLDLTAGLNLEPSNLHTLRRTSDQEYLIRQNVLNYSPTLRLNYKRSRSLNLRVHYRGESTQPTAHQLAPIVDNANPLVVYVGNEQLRPSFQHTLYSNLALFWGKKQSSLMFFSMLTMTENAIIPTSDYNRQTAVRTIGYRNVQGNWSARIGGFYSTPLWGKKFSLRLNTMNAFNNGISYTSGSRNQAKSLRLHEELALVYRDARWDTSLRAIWSYNHNRNSLNQLKGSTTQDYSLAWDNTLRLPFGLSLESSLMQTWGRGYSQGYENDQTMLNLSCSYSFLRNKAATIRLKVYDLLGDQKNVFRQETALTMTTQSTNIIGRYAMLHIIYKFNVMSNKSSSRSASIDAI